MLRIPDRSSIFTAEAKSMYLHVVLDVIRT